MHAEDPYDRGRPPTYESSALPGRAQPTPPGPYRHLPPPISHSHGHSSHAPPPPPPSQTQQQPTPYTASPQHERHPDLPPPQSGGHHSPNNHTPGANLNYSPRYKQEPRAPSTPSSTSQPSPAQDAYSAHPMQGTPYENHRKSMDDGRPESAYPGQDQHSHHGVPTHIASDYPSGSAFVPLQHSSSASGYDPAYHYGHAAGGMAGSQYRKKAARAAQACDQCRKKKAKCDESRPACGNCQSQGLECKYADVPPPKQDRTLIQMSEQLNQYSALLGSLMHELGSFKSEFRDGMRNFQTVQGTPKTVMSPSLQAPVKHADYPSMQMQIKSQDRGTHVFMTDFGAEGSPGETPDNDKKGGHRQRRSLSPRQTEELELDTLNGEATIPPEHTTAAHKLYGWSRIKCFYESITDAEYVQREELKRIPLLKANASKRTTGTARLKASPTARSEHDDTPMAPIAEGSRGTSSHQGVPTPSNEGGTSSYNQHENLENLPDKETGRRLLESYLKNMHLMHPILHEQTIRGLVDQFTSTHSISQAQMAASDTSGPVAWDSPSSWEHESNNGKSQKRKRPHYHGRSGQMEAPQNHRKTNANSTSLIDATLDNALVCLVFALGKICAFDSSLAPLYNPLPDSTANDVTCGPYTSTSLQQQIFNNSPQNQSPASSSPATPQSTGKPLPGATNDSVRNPPSSRTSWSSGAAAGHVNERRLYEPRDIDAIPGMVFYRRAAAILGELRGGNELQDIQACLLAGLYLAQLVRVRESWDWIHEACKKCGLLLKRLDFEKRRRQPEDAVRMVYWTCVQFESDLLAELDFLPNSGLSRFSEQINLPQGEDCFQEARTSERTMLYYSAQALLRKILDRIHSALYNSHSSRAENRKAGWSSMDAEGLLEQLQNWKSTLPELLDWDENSPTPARDINTARLRAKYYGARYVALRPFLQQYIHSEGVLRKGEKGLDNEDQSMTPMEGLTQPDFAQPSEPAADANNAHTDDQEASEPARRLLTQSNECAKAAKASTIVFDEIPTMPWRLIVTNIWGTAHAQFGNMLVLAAGRMCSETTWMSTDAEFDNLMNRTITFFKHLAPLSPTMHTDLKVLENARRIVHTYRSTTNSANPSFSNP